MKKNKLKKLLSIFVVTLINIFTITSCSFFDNEDNLNIPDEKKTLYTLHQQGVGNSHTLNSLGEQNILVIPVSFTDYTFNSTQHNLNNIKKTFFGESSDTGWESLSSYYYKSSFEKLKLNGFVTDWYNVGITSNELKSHKTTGTYADSGENGTWWLLNNAVTWFKNNYSSSDYGDINFDKDKDGFIDLVWLVYNVPHYTSTNKVDSTFWAFTFFDVDNYAYKSTSNPKPYTYCFASYDFMYEGYGNTSLDAHTFIHETGHALGANDYYDNNGKSYPLGCIDMMDYNIGDHCAYTKYTMGWTKPTYIVKNLSETTSYNLKSSNDYGEFILIADKFNNTPFDEYFIVELITPTGLNEKDYLDEYPGNNLQGYSKAGIRITHIDARALSYITFEYTNNFNYMYQIAASNTNDDDYINILTGNYYKEITLMQKNVNNTFINKNNVLTSNFEPSDNSLFYEGETFSLSSGYKYRTLMPSETNTLNKGGYFNYNIYISSLSAANATITISKN